MAGLDPEDFAGNERFRVQVRLGAGGYGVVYRALDLERNVPVALKTLRHIGGTTLVRFKQEFRALADVSHPNLATLYELSSHEDQWFFTMELVDGVNFLWYVRGDTYPAEAESTSVVSAAQRAHTDAGSPDTAAVAGRPAGTLDLDRLRGALPQLVAGVRALHEAGKLHRDIKPSNVLVTRDGRVVLLDFGLVTDLAPDHSHTVDAVGTPAYMSPEQMAGRPLTQASDWYNVGSLLYQALTGRLPFEGDVADVLRRKQESEPRPPRELSSEVPEDLDALCRDLLRRDPAARPSGAEVLRRLRAVGGNRGETAAPAAAAGASMFVGRDQHLEALRDAFRALKAGRTVVVLVHGGSGMGKSALVRRFLREVSERHEDVVVLSGRCYERESVPYKALDALVDALSRHLRRLPSAQAEVLLPHDILALARVFPVLRQVGAVNRARRAVLEIPDSLELRRRAFGALRELMVRLTDRRPLVLFIDDLQWGDVDSAAALEVLLRPPDPPALLFIGCYRGEEAETSPLLRNILPKLPGVDSALQIRDLVVGELSAREARELANALVTGNGSTHAARVDAIARESRGNPYFIEELARFSHRGGGEGPEVATDVTFEQVIETRVSRLPHAARQLLEVVAVSGAPLEVGVAYRAAELDAQGESALAILRAAHLVRTRSTPGRQEIETYHDRIRDAVVGRLSPTELQDCHHRLVSALLATGRADPETLATHYLGAGDAQSAAEYAAVAAAKASEALAFDRAAGLYRFALDLPLTRTPERARIEVQLGEALANAGRGLEAAQAYLSAAAAAGPALAVDLRRRAAQQFLVSGHIDEGVRTLETVLAALGMRLPDTPRRALLSMFVRRAAIRLRGLRFVERDESEIAAQDLLRIDTCWAVGVGMAVVDMVRGADFQARQLVLALRAGEPSRVARALALEGAYVAMGGNRSRDRARRLIQASHTLAERASHPYAVGLATLSAGIAAWLDGRWQEARVLSDQAEEILRERCTGALWELLLAQLFGLASLFFLGEIAALSRRLPSLLEEAEGRGNLLRATVLRLGFCSHVAWLAADDPATARQELETVVARWRRGDLDYLHLWVRAARTDITLYCGDPVAASDPVRATWRGMARALDRFIQTGFIRGLDSRGRRRVAAATQAANAADRDALLEGAERHARTILREKTLWGDPLALLVRAGAASTRHDTAGAVRLLESAESGLTAAAMALHAAVARRRRGELMGGETGRALVVAADAWMTAQAIKNPERMTAMLAPGRWRA
jgi:hypothetical protein